jgi:hypothetical protein
MFLQPTNATLIISFADTRRDETADNDGITTPAARAAEDDLIKVLLEMDMINNIND